MTLQQSLDKLKERIEGSMPPANVEIMHQATRDLEASGIGAKILKEGDKAPDFTLFNQNNERVSSSEILKTQSLVITFYRGVWCPYCNTDLANLKRYNDQVKELGATMLSISPQTPANNKTIVDRQRLNFDLLSDKGNEVAAQFGLRWEMVDPLRSLYENVFGISLPSFNGEDSWTLPVPARFIIGQDGVIEYAEYSVDYTKRPNPDVLVSKLESIKN